MEGSQYIARVKDIFWQKSEDSLYLVMEYKRGLTLEEFIGKANRKEFLLSTDHAAQIAYNLINAVNFIHQANVIHRDLKPANIMINDDLEITLLDFGHARTNPTARPLR